MSRNYLFLNHDLSYKLTGIEHASLRRAALFYDHLGIKPVIVTAKYNNRLLDIRDHLTNQGILKKDLSVVNLYEYFQGTYTNRRIQKKHNEMMNDDWEYQEVPGTKDVRVYQDGQLLMYQKRNEFGDLHYINYFHNGKKIRRDGFDCNGFLSVVQTLHRETNKVLQEVYYHVDGTPCIIKHFHDTEEECIMLVNHNGDITGVFNEEKELISYWLKMMTNPAETYYFFVDKNRIYYESLFDIQSQQHFIIPMIHSVHTKSATDLFQSRVNYNYKEIFDDVSKPDGIVFLTEKQKRDVEKRFGFLGHYYAIPHAITKLPKRVPFQQRSKRKVVALARYSKEKRLDLLIKLFARVIEQVPDAVLEIYGYGSEKSNLKNLIKELKQESNILLRPYSDQPSQVYESSVLSLVTSNGEGFSLVTLESLTHGCPVGSFDINYGPSDMICDGENGFLVPRDDEETFINRTIEVLTNEELNKMMSMNAYQYSEKFESQHVAEKWKELLLQVTEQRRLKDVPF